MEIPKAILGLYVAAARESSKYAINALRVSREKDKCRAAVTDGRTLVECTWHVDTTKGDGAFPETLVPRELAEHAVAHLDDVRLSRDGDVVRLAGTSPNMEATLTGPQAEGKFPNTKGIVPTYGPDEATSINVDPYRLAEAAGILARTIPEGRRGAVSCSMTIPKDGTHPIRLDLDIALGDTGLLKARTAIMPMVR
jgi:hypothetical protein